VFICDRVPHRVELARRIGVDVAVRSSKELIEAVLDETRGRGADVVLEAAGDRETVNAALAMARPGGTVVQIGLPAEINMPVDLHIAMAKELRIQTLKRSNHCAEKAIRLMEAGAIPDLLITHRIPLEQTPDAFEMLANYRDGVGKIVIEIAR
jgi:L-iditol 2-dehydrogenase